MDGNHKMDNNKAQPFEPLRMKKSLIEEYDS
jgi:hypothetical protein